MEYKYIRHGSENSLDKDVYVVINEPLIMKDAKKLCDSFKDINANLITVKNGIVDWVYKGTKDECNNSILATFKLHEQTEEKCPIERKLDRVYALKMLRTIRGLLSYASRTEHREIIKKALSSNKMEDKFEALKVINLNKINDFEKTNIIETYKFYAFQLGQTMALLKDNVELFTKNSVSSYYPQLKDYLERKEASPEKLQDFFIDFISFIEKECKPLEKIELYVSYFHGKKEVFEVKKEMVLPPVVIFDIDGTLLNEQHREEYRDKKDWENYFNLAKFDTEFQNVIDLTHKYKNEGYEVWLVSGRAIRIKEDTIESLKKYNVYYDHMKLRGEGNFIPDYVIKPAWVKKLIGMERVEAVYEDQDKVIQAFRKYGLNVIDVKDLENNGKAHYRKTKTI